MNFIKWLICLGIIFMYHFTEAQIFINELESDSPGIDDREFIEIRTIQPNTSLNGYILVFFNGNASSSTANLSYYAVSLSGIVTDLNGIATIGNNLVSPVPDLILPDNTIQNGEDAVAIYQASITDFPEGTLANTTNLIHALAYDTSDPDALVLMSLLGITSPQMDENQNGASATESIQRKNDGTFEIKAPTPCAMNDGTGIQYNGISILAATQHRDEGDTIHITFTTQQNVNTSPLTFSFTLNNAGGFTNSDFTGNTNITIPVGSNTATTIITTLDDVLNEGDEVLKIKFGALPNGYNRLNDNLEIRIVDNDYTIDPWGPPNNPTFGIVNSTAPTGYYSSINGLSGAALRQALQDIIADSTIIQAHCYGDMFTILNEADHHPKNSNQVWLMYTETPRAKLDLQTTGIGTDKWNREHIFPQSRGGFSNGTSDIPDGINVYLPSNANDLLAGHADAHHLRAEDATENSSRSNRDYGQDYNGPAGNVGSWKGDVARALFYMCVRYNGLNLIAGNPDDTTKFVMGDLDSLLAWDISDPKDDFEMNRNNYIYTWQKNRNPFIDLPDLASYIWGGNVGQPYEVTLSVANNLSDVLKIYPNPTNGKFYLASEKSHVIEVKFYSMLGKFVKQLNDIDNGPINIDLPEGMYFLHIKTSKGSTVKKLQIF